jgi:hypothetical protein
MGQKINRQRIHELRVAGDYRAAHAAALKYKIACRELLCSNIGDNYLAVREEHGFISALIDLIVKEIEDDDRKKYSQKRKRINELEKRMKVRSGSEYAQGIGEYHIDPEILAAAETNELVFDRDF